MGEGRVEGWEPGAGDGQGEAQGWVYVCAY